ncbi:hypothetical protein IC235_13935 [Hymenobacter sp. BT664]|uniref:Uncharacterized protein n=1 Tax=Hymenobacter montanus TaxID=2771359 RepID=A0A927BFI6_9BACT|nr:hypothetical protein [Hymenobacter montanus]MBD2768988.1 hypothetical protein [Hymenobacter montanus]
MPLRLSICFQLLAVLAGGLLGTGCVRKNFFQPDARPEADLAYRLPATADSVRGATAGRQYARPSRLYQVLVGRHHRRSWAAPVTVAVLSLAQARRGGLQPGKVGGGFNSTSLALAAADGQTYVLRTVDKDPIRATPKLLRGTFLVNALRDNVSATYPYGALVVPPLSRAVSVPSAAPRLVYVRADDPDFQGDSLRLFRGQLAYLEEKFALSPTQPALDDARTVKSSEAFAAVFAHPSQRIDQAALLRARLLDGWLGDWDRHAGQWSWALTESSQTGLTTFAPLPKDRDMVFYRLDDGLLGWLLGHVIQRHWVTFGPSYRNVPGLVSSGRYLDTRGLNQLTRIQFGAAARAMQRQLPDTLIDRAVRRLPPAAFALEGPRLINALKARRDALPRLATAMYEQLARRPVVGGTAEAERFEVHRYADSTVVAVYAAQGTTRTYRRCFLPTETQRIQLEGLGGDDVFVIENHAPKKVSRPQLRLYGGPGTDELRAQTTTKGIHFSQGSLPTKHAYNCPPKE